MKNIFTVSAVMLNDIPEDIDDLANYNRQQTINIFSRSIKEESTINEVTVVCSYAMSVQGKERYINSKHINHYQYFFNNYGRKFDSSKLIDSNCGNKDIDAVFKTEFSTRKVLL